MCIQLTILWWAPLLGGWMFIEHLLCARHALSICSFITQSQPHFHFWVFAHAVLCAHSPLLQACVSGLFPCTSHPNGCPLTGLPCSSLSPKSLAVPRFPRIFFITLCSLWNLPYSLFYPCLSHYNANTTGENALHCHHCNPHTRNWAGSWQQLHKCLSNEWNSPWKRYH